MSILARISARIRRGQHNADPSGRQQNQDAGLRTTHDTAASPGAAECRRSTSTTAALMEDQGDHLLDVENCETKASGQNLLDGASEDPEKAKPAQESEQDAAKQKELEKCRTEENPIGEKEMTQPLTILDLPLEIKLKIFSDPLLHWKDLLSLSHCSQNLCDDALWQIQCETHWLQTLKRDDQTWKEIFMSYFRDWGRYIHCYKNIRQVWNRIEGVLKDSCPQIFESLKEGMTESTLDAMEVRRGLHLPLDLRCSLRICNGQRHDTISLGSMLGLMGSSSLPSSRVHPGSIPGPSIHPYINETCQFNISEYLLDLETAFGTVCMDSDLYTCLPLTFTFCGFLKGFNQFLCLKDVGPLQAGQVFYPFGSYGSVFEGRLHGLDFNVWNAYVDDLPFKDVSLKGSFIAAHSFTDWLSRYAIRLERQTFPALNQISRFTTIEPQILQTLPLDSPEAGSIAINVETCFLPDFLICTDIQRPSFFHAVRLCISLRDDAPACYASRLYAVQISIEENGQVDERNVFDDHPLLLRPGDRHTINFQCVTSSPARIAGYCIFTKANTLNVFQVDVSVVQLLPLPYVTGFCHLREKGKLKKFRRILQKLF